MHDSDDIHAGYLEANALDLRKTERIKPPRHFSP